MADTDSVGRTFEWLRLLGSGGSGEVHLARMHSLNGLSQLRAVKILKADLAPDSRAVARLRDEARVLTTLRHPVVLAPDDLAEFGRRVALVTEFIDGEDLADCIDHDKPSPLPLSTQIEIVGHVASALDLAWKQLRVVHRDIKPQNIRIGVHGNVKLLDFGLAAIVGADHSAASARSELVVGTRRYLAPERFLPRRPPGPAADVYALGCVLYEGVTGTPLVDREAAPPVDTTEAAWKPFLEARLEAVSETAVRLLLETMLAHDPEHRPSAHDVRRRCERLNAEDGAGRVSLSRWCEEHIWSALDLDPIPYPSPVSDALQDLESSGSGGLAARGPPHLGPDRLAADHLSAEEDFHLEACLFCRSDRRTLRSVRWVGPYRVLGRIGQGGMAQVFAATKGEDGPRCALKMVSVARRGFDKRIAREARLQQRIASPNVLQIVDVIEFRSRTVLVLPYVDGPNLGELLNAHPVPPEVAAAWFVAIVDGVAALHDAGFIHRDLKPSNVLLDPSSGAVVPKVADLGLAKALSDDPSTTLTQTGMGIGTHGYAAPEQTYASKLADARADVWSLGVLAVELFTGQRERQPEHPLPEPWNAIVGRLLQPDRAERPANAREVARLLPSPQRVDAVWVDRCRALSPRIERGYRLPGDNSEDPTPEPIPPRPRAWWALALAGGAVPAMILLGLRIDTAPIAPTPVSDPPDPEPPVEMLYPHRTEERMEAPAPPPRPATARRAPPAPVVEPGEPVPVWVKTQPWGHVFIGAERWETEDRHMRLPPGHYVLKLESDSQEFVVELPFDVTAEGPNRVCWDFARAAPCSS